MVAGQPTMIQGAGFKVGESVSADIHSTSIHLADFTAGSLGIAIGTVTVPIDTVVGYHEIFLTGGTSGHVDIIRAWIIQGSTQAVTAASTSGTPPASGSPSSSPSTSAGTTTAHTGPLAYTGAGRGLWLTLAGGLLLLNLGYLVMTMFCRPRSSPASCVGPPRDHCAASRNRPTNAAPPVPMVALFRQAP